MGPGLRTSLDAHRTTVANELFEIAALLERHDLSPDTGPIRDAAGQCKGAFKVAPQDAPDCGRSFWGYEIVNLKIRLENQRHLRPRRSNIDNALGSLCVTAQEYLPERSTDIGESYSLLRKLDVDFFFEGLLDVDGSAHILRAAWHVDTHLHLDSVTREVHPRFHFQMGGERLDDIDHEIRGILVTEAPRLPIPPLDAILAVDFVLSHYCGETWNLLKDEPRYGRIRKNPMQRYWSPYYQTIATGIVDLDIDPTGGEASALNPSIFIGVQ